MASKWREMAKKWRKTLKKSFKWVNPFSPLLFLPISIIIISFAFLSLCLSLYIPLCYPICKVVNESGRKVEKPLILNGSSVFEVHIATSLFKRKCFVIWLLFLLRFYHIKSLQKQHCDKLSHLFKHLRQNVS